LDDIFKRLKSLGFIAADGVLAWGKQAVKTGQFHMRSPTLPTNRIPTIKPVL
jgi:hypothetical protein